MPDEIVARIVRESGIPNLLEVLAEDLEPTDLQSLLLEVFRRRAAQQTPSRVLERYEQNPFVRPTEADPRALLELDLLALAHATPLFEAVELSPLAPLGACSALAPVDQNRVVSTARNTEIVSDSTNVLALECALRRKGQRRNTSQAHTTVRLCASHRLVRAQRYNQPNMRAHFRMFTLATAGRAGAPSDFEAASLIEHLAFYLHFLAATQSQGYNLTNLRITFTPFSGDEAQARLQQSVIDPLSAQFPLARLEMDPNDTTRDYYEWVRFRLYASNAQGTEYMIGDGGFNNWTGRLLSNRRERLLTSGIATERLATLFV